MGLRHCILKRMMESSFGWLKLGRRKAAGLRLRSLLWLLAAVAIALGGRSQAQQNLVSAIQIHGNRRIPAETIRARIFTRPGDVYDQAAIERDFNSLWNTGYFEDLRIEREETSQ